MGDAGTVKLSGSAMNEIEIWEVKDYPRPPISEGLPPNVYADGLYQGSCPNHIYVYQDLVRALKSANHIYINGKEARKSLYIVNAIYKSSEKGKAIKISET
jgi:predicted dehydrogenase